MLLAAGAFTELVTISFPTTVYLGNNAGNEEISKHKWSFHDDGIVGEGEHGEKTRHWEPISGTTLPFYPIFLLIMKSDVGQWQRKTGLYALPEHQWRLRSDEAFQ